MSSAETTPTPAPSTPAVLGEAPARCPRCQGPFSAITTPQGVSVDRCAGCRSIWLDKGEINFFTEEWEYLRDYALSKAHPTSLACPACGQLLQEGMWTSADIKVDKCPNCGGLFFEAGELGAVGRLHPQVEHVLSESHRPDWFAFPRVYFLAGSVVVLAAALVWTLTGLATTGLPAPALALAGLALLVLLTCRHTGNELGEVSLRALRGLHFPGSWVPQHVMVSGHLRAAADEIRLVDPTGTLAVWERSAIPPLAWLDESWVAQLRAIPADQTIRIEGWYRAFPGRHFQGIRAYAPTGEIRASQANFRLRALAGLATLLLVLAVALPTLRARPFIGYSAARELVLSDADAWLHLGLGAAYRRDYDAARAHLQKAVDSDVEGLADDRAVADAHHNLGVILLLQHKADDARAAFDAALRKFPGHRPARQGLDVLNARTPFGLPGADFAPDGAK